MILRITELNETIRKDLTILGEKFYPASGLNGTFRPGTFMTFISELLSRGIMALWASFDGDRMTGTIGMQISISLPDGVTTVEEVFWFVDPEHRGTTGVRLFHAAEEWAKQSGAKRMVMARMLAGDSEKVGDFYERHNFKPLQTQYFKELC